MPHIKTPVRPPSFIVCSALLLGFAAFTTGCAGPKAALKAEWLPDSTGWEVRDVDASPSAQWVIYERDALIADVKEFRIVGMIDAPPDVAARALRKRLLDEQYVGGGLEREILKQTESEIVIYGLQPVPFPFDDREGTERIRFTEDPATGEVRVEAVGIVPDGEPKSGVLRIPVVRNAWTFTPTKTGQTILTNDTVHDIGGNFPNWLIYGPVCDQLVTDLFILRELTASPASLGT